nr:AraC family transcriptional regulator [Kribbella sandramycini]
MGDVVRTVWIQRTGPADHLHRHLPTGGVELHFPLGGRPQLLGPLTGPALELIPARTTIVGIRFHPGTAPPFPVALDELVDQRLPLAEVWGHTLVDELPATPEYALAALQTQLLQRFRSGPDPLVRAAAVALMPWQPTTVDAVANRLALSASQLRRRCLHTVGTTPKVLQRILRFQGFLALAQAGVAPSGRRGLDGTAGLAIDAGYADQAHLSRECVRLTGLTPTQLLGTDLDRCACGHDHAGSYEPFLAGMRDLFKSRAVARA